ncbi:MAG: DUF255 domain-containing protein [Elusimicrobiota bacterium]
MATPKEIHNRVMIILGFFFLGMGLIAAYLDLSSGNLPSFFYGLRMSPEKNTSPYVGQKPDLVPWLKWSPRALALAKKSHHLILLDISAEWSSASRAADSSLFADSDTASFIKSRFIPIRADADERPDLVLRYLSRGWPAIDILSPSGNLISAGIATAPGFFAAWADEALALEERNPQALAAAAEKNTREILRGGVSPIATPDDAILRQDLDHDKVLLESQNRSSPRFPFFDRISWLQRIGAPWAENLARLRAADNLHLEDKTSGGFYRYARGPGWSNPAPAIGKRLADQAGAILAMAAFEPRAARRAAAYADHSSFQPGGGYASSRIDSRIFAGANGLMAQAILDNRQILNRREAAKALKTLGRWKKFGINDGCARHNLLSTGSLSCDLEDQVNLGMAFLAAYEATRSDSYRMCALRLAHGSENNLKDPHSAAFYDRPKLRELPPDIDRIADPMLNAQAMVFFKRLSRDIAPGPIKTHWATRVGDLELWLFARRERLDPAASAFLVSSVLTPPRPAKPR